MSTLHTVNRSPYLDSALASCLRYAAPGSAVLLIEDAVVAAVAGSLWAERLAQEAGEFRLYALAADVAARGLSAKLMPGIALVGDAGFVALALAHDKVVAWS